MSQAISYVTNNILSEKIEMISVNILLNSAVTYFFTRIENLIADIKTGIFRPGKNGKCIKLKFETCGEGSSDHCCQSM